MSGKIFLVDDNEINRQLVEVILAKEGYEVACVQNAAEALANINRVKPDLAILDVLMPDMDGFELCRRLRSRPETATMPIIILTALNELEQRLKAFEVGADDFIPKPFQPAELVARVKVALKRTALQTGGGFSGIGEITAVFSLRGGTGVSSFASNLAIGLSQIWNAPVTLVDLCLVSGISALMLDLPLRTSWSALAKTPAAEIDDQIINQVLMQHESGVRVLAAPRRPQEAELLTGDQVLQALSVIKKQAEYVILDLPHDFSDTTLAGLDAADNLLILLAPELASIQSASIALDVFSTLSYPADKTKLILNWTYKGKGIPKEEIEKVLHRNIDLVFPFAGDQLTNALTFGKPPVYGSPKSALGGLFEDLAYYLSKPEHKKAPIKPYSEALERVISRARTRHK